MIRRYFVTQPSSVAARTQNAHRPSHISIRASWGPGFFWGGGGGSLPKKVATPLQILSSCYADNDLQQSAPPKCTQFPPPKKNRPPGSLSYAIYLQHNVFLLDNQTDKDATFENMIIHLICLIITQTKITHLKI